MADYAIRVSPDFRTGPWSIEQLITWEANLKQFMQRLEKQIAYGRIDKELFAAYGPRMTRSRYWALQRSVLAGAKKDLRAVKERLYVLKRQA